MRIDLITIGSELLSGHTLNTNAFFVGEQLRIASLSLARQVSIPDQHHVIVETLRDSLGRFDWVIVSGGLGPTNDDVTKMAVAEVCGKELVFHTVILDELRQRYIRMGREVTPLLETQALLPADVETIPNPLGTAVGFYLKTATSMLVAVPGVPREMRPMIADYVVPRIAREAQVSARTIVWSTTGVPESRLYEMLSPTMKEQEEIDVAFLPSEYGVRLKFSSSGPDADSNLKNWLGRAGPILGAAVYAEEDVGLEFVLGRILAERRLRIAFAESCTGGLIAKRMTDVPGSSAYVTAGFVTYSNDAKAAILGVDEYLIREHGAVSEEVAKGMAEGAITKTGANCSIAVTGIAGPDGGSTEKPVGLVWIATTYAGQTQAKRLQLMGDREIIRERAAQAAMNLLRLRILNLSL